MKSSKMENVFELNSSVEEAKTLSPFNYYQPFRSSFDPGFAVQSRKGLRESPPQGIWEQGVDLRQRVLCGVGSTSPWEEDQLMPGHSSAAGGSASPRCLDRRDLPCFSRTGLPSVSPGRHSFRGYSEEPTPKHARDGLGTFSAFPPRASCGSDPGFPEFNDGGPGFEDPAVRMENSTQTTARATLGNPAYYPLVLNSLPQNSSQNNFKTGHSRPMVCNFCKNNKEIPDIYLNHYLYDPETKILTCPVLRKHVCEICGGTGDRAHTLQYCPVNRERGLQAKVPVLLRTRTITNSTGKIRKN